MKLQELKQNISLNLLSFLGYIFVILVLLILFYVYPQTISDSLKDGPTDNFEVTVGTFFLIAKVIVQFFIIELILFFLIFSEAKFNKIKQYLNNNVFTKIPNQINKIHTIIFCAGIILAFIPVIIVVLYLLAWISEYILFYLNIYL